MDSAGSAEEVLFRLVQEYKNGPEERSRQIRGAMCDNAFSFLERAIGEFESDPAFSLLHFALASELFLKARVMQQFGWESIISPSDAAVDLSTVETAEFHTISMKDCCIRLRGAGLLRSSEKKALVGLAQHRNKLVHFHHPTISESLPSIAIRQSKCWFILKKHILRLEFDYEARVEAVTGQMELLRPHLESVYSQRQRDRRDLLDDGADFCDCPVCEFESFLLHNPYQPEDTPYAELSCMTCDVTVSSDFTGHCAECDTLESLVDVGGAIMCANCHQVHHDWGSCQNCGAICSSLPQGEDGEGDVSVYLGCVECPGPMN